MRTESKSLGNEKSLFIKFGKNLQFLQPINKSKTSHRVLLSTSCLLHHGGNITSKTDSHYKGSYGSGKEPKVIAEVEKSGAQLSTYPPSSVLTCIQVFHILQKFTHKIESI